MVTLPLKNNIMKNTIKMLLIGVSLIANLSCAQTIMMKTTSDAKKLEINKKEFIGKPLSYLLTKMEVEIIKSNLTSTIKPRILVKRKKKVFMKQKMVGFIV